VAEGLGQRNGGKATPLTALVEAALDQPRPTRALKAALNVMLDTTQHLSRLRPVIEAATPLKWRRA
jgi:hypothetical protein